MSSWNVVRQGPASRLRSTEVVGFVGVAGVVRYASVPERAKAGKGKVELEGAEKRTLSPRIGSCVGSGPSTERSTGELKPNASMPASTACRAMQGDVGRWLGSKRPWMGCWEI